MARPDNLRASGIPQFHGLAGCGFPGTSCFVLIKMARAEGENGNSGFLAMLGLRQRVDWGREGSALPLITSSAHLIFPWICLQANHCAQAVKQKQGSVCCVLAVISSSSPRGWNQPSKTEEQWSLMWSCGIVQLIVELCNCGMVELWN